MAQEHIIIKHRFLYKDILFVICVVAILIIAFIFHNTSLSLGLLMLVYQVIPHKIGRITVHQDTPYFYITYSMPYFQYHDDKIGYHS